MDSLNANGNDTQEFCNIQYEHFVAPYGGMMYGIWNIKLNF